MSQNPFQSPGTDPRAIGIQSGDVGDLRKVAVYQKGILVCILVYMLSGIGQAVLGQMQILPPALTIALAVGVLVVILIGTIFVFLLAMKVYNPVLGILLGILALVPCIGLLVLLAVNSKATTVLRQNGIKVGLLGANLSQL